MFEKLFKRVKENFTDHTADIQRTNCKHLMPASKRVPHIHCNNGKGDEGDCFIYLKQSDSCIFHDPIFTPLSKEEIEENISKMEMESKYIRRCLDAQICPECGYDLMIDFLDESEFIYGMCNICQKTYVIV